MAKASAAVMESLAESYIEAVGVDENDATIFVFCTRTTGNTS
jgi:hypothetical protein